MDLPRCVSRGGVAVRNGTGGESGVTMRDLSAESGLMTIRAMCDMYDVTARALRFYESRGLLTPLRRGQHRLYDRRDRARLQLILRGKRFGFSLDQIGHLLELYDPDGSNRNQVTETLAMARDRLRDMQEQHDALGTAILELREQIALGEAHLSGPGGRPTA